MVTINIFWTGGFESTFRVCQLSLLNVQIQPFYISDSRESEKNELKAIVDISNLIHSRKNVKANLLPLIYVRQNEIVRNQKITDSFNALRRISKIGDQYDFLARYAEQMNLKFEVGFEFVPSARASICLREYGYLIDVSEPVPGGGFVEYSELESSRSLDDLNNVFGNFRFGLPLIKMNKLETLIAYKNIGYEEVVAMTWFCHHPRKGKPCGLCRPCEQVMQSKMEFRLPKKSKVYYRIFRKNSFGKFIYKIFKVIRNPQLLNIKYQLARELKLHTWQ